MRSEICNRACVALESDIVGEVCNTGHVAFEDFFNMGHVVLEDLHISRIAVAAVPMCVMVATLTMLQPRELAIPPFRPLLGHRRHCK